jgi:RND family efflux transporter MFP subunit
MMTNVTSLQPRPAQGPRPGSVRLWLGLGVVAVALAGGCNHGAAPTRGGKTAEVVVTEPISEEVVDYQDFTGRLSAVKTVEVRARVTGYLKEAPFHEGELVKEGDLLFQVDPRSYAADWKLADANLKVAQAERDIHERDLERDRRLADRKNVISAKDFDLTVANLEKDRARVEAMEANRERSKLYLDWTQVKAPLSGRVGRQLVDPGNLVTADHTVLTTIVSDDRVYVYFDVDERTWLELTGTPVSKMSTVARRNFPVVMRLANEEEFRHAGVVDFIDNQVNAGTGTIRMRGVFANPQGLLKAGLFARVRLPLGNPYRATLIPDEALMSDQGRKYVFVLNDRNEIVYRKVRLGQAIGGLRVIKEAEPGLEDKEGVRPGERVVVSGMQRVRPAMEVTVQTQPAPARPDSPLLKLLAATRVAGDAPQHTNGGGQ